MNLAPLLKAGHDEKHRVATRLGRVLWMDPSPPDELTKLLVAGGNGDENARDQLAGVVYQELHRLAHHYMRKESPGHTLQTSGLVNETFLRLIDQRDVQWRNRAHFFGIAAQMMRRILVDYARRRRYAKRGGGATEIPLDEARVISNELSAEVVALDEALDRLSVLDQRKSQIVELRCFGGLSVGETAEVLGVSPGTIHRDWTLAKPGCVGRWHTVLYTRCSKTVPGHRTPKGSYSPMIFTSTRFVRPPSNSP